ncbi:MAG: prepilin-type N-terminal cleavage/methylation domain-containing protein [Candidatus Magasanikbacteria bacterium]|nr:prepilin-type N-terminal cleavage/methylation domain-containing protein [Candidatus Magasanikbacteria bacterium]
MLSKIGNKKGFTLIEVIVVIALLAILATIVLVAINPAQNSKDARNTKRRSDVLQVLNAVNQYYVANGSFPSGMPTIAQSPADIKSGATPAGDICSGIVPTYIAALPYDTGGNYTSCSTYDTKYTISIVTGNRVTVSVTDSEGTGISATR